LGSEEFRSKLLEQIEGKLGEHDSGQLRQESTKAKGERIIAAELKRLKWGRRRISEAESTLEDAFGNVPINAKHLAKSV